MRKFHKNTENIRYSQTINTRAKPYETPGPGDYDISLPIVKPNYEAIKKNDDIVIIKINHNGESANFKPSLRFRD